MTTKKSIRKRALSIGLANRGLIHQCRGSKREFYRGFMVACWSIIDYIDTGSKTRISKRLSTQIQRGDV